MYWQTTATSVRRWRLWGKGAATQRAVDVLEGTFPQQRAFIEDPAKLKWALCTRCAAEWVYGHLSDREYREAVQVLPQAQSAVRADPSPPTGGGIAFFKQTAGTRSCPGRR
jgi:hypothetical protein